MGLVLDEVFRSYEALVLHAAKRVGCVGKADPMALGSSNFQRQELLIS